MAWNRIDQDYSGFKGQALSQWHEITGEEWDRAEGRRENLERLLQEKYGHDRQEAGERIEALLDRL
ncbi:CsbD family protein [Jannaschia aquimarina]|uniref:CsbD-like domain-containing protein n=1 Tax=Jannaschia aquimarina TaxID=935700 RepID=A0A0D1EFM7_9RHOB|nr:hypothetical protein [Jannaschia aquimarina]KIT14680.1 hypothetical protein jaqu_36220 [Jannaschia aquimarina]SNT38067.1 Uncharacterized conserved protein YjbJ, UPF0337 family [Jannaschia aquimarina]